MSASFVRSIHSFGATDMAEDENKGPETIVPANFSISTRKASSACCRSSQRFRASVIADDRFRLRIEARDALASGRVLDVAQPVPDQLADIELIVDDARAALHMAAYGRVVPELTVRTGTPSSFSVRAIVRGAIPDAKSRNTRRTTLASASSIWRSPRIGSPRASSCLTTL